ncbi:MAG: hypothetical protein LW719_06475 [Comamonadaceae bacterium]|nr:hypothetical protein [Comamonadaceae bacterium]
MKPLLIVALSAALLGGCSSTPLVSGSADQVQAPTEAISQSTLPPGATMKPELSLIIGSGAQWVGRVVATVGKDIDAAIRFFIDTYQGQGWTLISSVRGKSSLLVFTRQDRTATVELVEGGLMSGGTVTLTVAPRNATVVAPKRP